MAIKIDTPLKQAIVAMPVTEKDKLLLRLIAKDGALVERLNFELLEGTNDDRERRSTEIRSAIERFFEQYHSDTPGWLLMDFRNFSGTISQHVKTTKDKLGEVSLNARLLALGFEKHHAMLHKMPKRADTLAPYVVKKVQTLLNRAEKLHEDYHIEFRADLQATLDFIWSYPPMAALAEQIYLPRKFNL
jgi:hypothetical protein